MLFFLILGLLVGAVAVVFALQNIVIITVTFLVWQIQGSLAIILFLAIISGVLISVLVSIPEVVGDYIKYSNLKKENKKLLEEIEGYKKMLVDINAKNLDNTPTHVGSSLY